MRLLSTVLSKEGFKNIYTAETGVQRLRLFETIKPDIIILDIMLPDKEGYDICKKIRQTSMVPILFLSARTEELDRILGFALGGDDYITKPFSPKEVFYRIKGQLKRNIIPDMSKRNLFFGPFEVNEDEMVILKNGVNLKLKPKELKLFLYLAKNHNKIISKEKICDEVWGEAYIGFDNTIMVHVRRLREKIEDDTSKPKYIVNVKGLGYKFNIEGE